MGAAASLPLKMMFSASALVSAPAPGVLLHHSGHRSACSAVPAGAAGSSSGLRQAGLRSTFVASSQYLRTLRSPAAASPQPGQAFRAEASSAIIAAAGLDASTTSIVGTVALLGGITAAAVWAILKSTDPARVDERIATSLDEQREMMMKNSNRQQRRQLEKMKKKDKDMKKVKF
eukprot:tig00000227_g19804.t1